MEGVAEYLKSLKSGPSLQKLLNYKLIPVTRIKANYDGMLLFNSIIDYVKNLKDISKIVRTKSGGISVKGVVIYPAYDIQTLSSGVELTLLLSEGTYRIIFTNIDLNGEVIKMYGYQAFGIFKGLCGRFNIDLDSYAVENGKEYKEMIEKPYICLTNDCIAGYTYDSVHHIDIHSAWPSNLCNEYPEFYPVFNYLYENRKRKPEYKSVMNETIGYFQSIKMCNARWSYLSMSAINGCNRQIEELSNRLILSGRKILCYNTDGIWYQGDIFHDKGEGDKLGQWHNDHINCYWRCRSAGAYEYMDEEGKITIVLRGSCNLDKYKPRDSWDWDDLFLPDTRIDVFYYDKEMEKIVYEKET